MKKSCWYTACAKSELAYFEYFSETLPNDETLGELIAPKLSYLPTVTREEFTTQGRITTLMEDGTLNLDPASDRVMLCGSQDMLRDVSAALDARGFVGCPGKGRQATTYLSAPSSSNSDTVIVVLALG